MERQLYKHLCPMYRDSHQVKDWFIVQQIGKPYASICHTWKICFFFFSCIIECEIILIKILCCMPHMRYAHEINRNIYITKWKEVINSFLFFFKLTTQRFNKVIYKNNRSANNYKTCKFCHESKGIISIKRRNKLKRYLKTLTLPKVHTAKMFILKG